MTGHHHTSATVLSLVCLALVCLACGSSSAVRSSSGITRSTFESDREYDDPPLKDSELSSRTQNAVASPVPPEPPTEAPEMSPLKAVRGYRIQLFSLRDKKAADEAKRRLEKQLADLPGARIYIDHESPYYKVRVGDYRTKAEAEQRMKTLRDRKGFSDAWIVETLIEPEYTIIIEERTINE